MFTRDELALIQTAIEFYLEEHLDLDEDGGICTPPHKDSEESHILNIHQKIDEILYS